MTYSDWFKILMKEGLVFFGKPTLIVFGFIICVGFFLGLGGAAAFASAVTMVFLFAGAIAAVSSTASQMTRVPELIVHLKDLITRQQAFIRKHGQPSTALFADLAVKSPYMSIGEVSDRGESVVVRVDLNQEFRFHVRVTEDSAELVGWSNLVHPETKPWLEEAGIIVLKDSAPAAESEQPKLA